jgi:ABC-type dipeptide/oligopeptide/nickel transport system permease component
VSTLTEGTIPTQGGGAPLVVTGGPNALQRNRWWITRVLVLPVHILVFTVLSFIMVRSMPGDPVLNLLGQNYTPEGYAELQAQLGLDGSVWQQFQGYLGQLLTLDLGNSIATGRPVLTELSERLPQTLELAGLGLFFAVVCSTVAALFAVLRPTNWFAHAVRVYARTAGALPEYVVAIAALFLCYAVLHVVPAPVGRIAPDLPAPTTVTGFPLLDTVLQGYWQATISMLGHLVLPVVVMVVAHSALLTRMLLAGLDEAVDNPQTRFRIASGAKRSAVVVSMLRRAAPPAVTTTGTLFGYLLGGAVVIESLFGLSGLGGYAVDAVSSSDVMAMQGFLLVIATLSLLVFLAVDLVNMSVDPRRRPGLGGSSS